MKHLNLAGWIGLWVVTSVGGGEGYAADVARVSVAKVPPVTLSKKMPVGLMLDIRVAPGFHIQANPASEPRLIATVLEVGADKNVAVGQPIYPPGKPYRLPGANYDVSTFSGDFKIEVPMNATPDAKPGKRELKAKLKYQACDNKTCFPPKDVLIPVTVVIGDK